MSASALPFRDIVSLRLSRRTFLAGAASSGALIASGCATGMTGRDSASPALDFDGIGPTVADTVSVPEGFTAHTLIRWGDPLFDDAPELDMLAPTEAAASARFGTNNDMLALFPQPFAYPLKAEAPDSMLMCTNHEYFSLKLNFDPSLEMASMDASSVRGVFAQMGCAVVQLERDGRGPGQGWAVRRDPAPGSGLNRRITPFTEVLFSGPAADHDWIKRAAKVWNASETAAGNAPKAGGVMCGTLANCAGGFTPWGTYLTAEENYDYYYTFRAKDGGPQWYEPENAAMAFDYASTIGNRFIKGSRVATDGAFAGYPDQYDLALNPTAPSIYGWIVEIDPYDPDWTPRKRTALGRRKSECATIALTRSGQVASYSGDDQRNEFVYKFISSGTHNPDDRRANRDLLDDGTLYAAQFNEDGTGQWLALTLETANAAAKANDAPPFSDLGDVMVRARQAARLLGATPMDRPEDVECPLDARFVGTGEVFIACTENKRSASAEPGNPRREGEDGVVEPNWTGHIVRLLEAGGDCGATAFAWDVYVLAGDPGNRFAAVPDAGGETVNVSVSLAADAATFEGARFARPDNFTFDVHGRVWLTTDGSPDVFGDCNDGVYCIDPRDGAPHEVKRFLTGPIGCELCGPLFAPGGEAFFCAIQHPGQDDGQGTDYQDLVSKDPNARPASSWPDGKGAWPRSSIVYVTRDAGGPIIA